MNKTNKNCIDHGACPSEALSLDQIQILMQKINPNWFLDNKNSNSNALKISRVFEFASYQDALDRFNQIANIAIKLNHHPDLNLEYKKLTVKYWTHNAQGLTFVDFEAINAIDALDDNR